MAVPPLIDTHVHFLDLNRFNYPWLGSPDARWMANDYLPSDWKRDADGLKVAGLVHVQAEVDHSIDPVEETAWLQSLKDASDHGIPSVCVGYADLRAPDLADALERHSRFSLFRGIRQEAWYHPKSEQADMPTENFLSDPSWVGGLRELESRRLSFDLMIWPHQLDQAAAIFARFPDLPVVLDHLGLPQLHDLGAMDVWRRGISRFAREVPSSVLKLSAMRFAGERWTTKEIRPLVLECIEIFGTSRCMFGSDYPVERRACSYGSLWYAYDEITKDFSEAERSELFRDTASRFYRMP